MRAKRTAGPPDVSSISTLTLWTGAFGPSPIPVQEIRARTDCAAEPGRSAAERVTVRVQLKGAQPGRCILEEGPRCGCRISSVVQTGQ